MAIPGFGLVSGETRETGGNVELLELVDGITVQQFRRRARSNQNMQQIPYLTAWGITPQTSVFAESITLTVTEEGIPHERWLEVAPNASTDCVALDAFLIFRARVSLNISGKAAVGTTINNTGWTSAIGNYAVDTILAALGSCTPFILTNQSNTEPRTNWHQFVREWQCIRPGATNGTHILTPAMITGGSYGTYTFSWTWSAEGFPTKSESYQQA